MRSILLTLILTFISLPAAADWDFSGSRIDTDEIVSGGPPKDGIPAILDPKFIPGRQSDFMRPDEKVLGVVVDGIAKAYPTRILSWHELVNDKFGDTAVLVSW
jgi:hypothetical protein